MTENATFKALVIDRVDERIEAAVKELPDESLPEGNVVVDVEYSSINYKDALVLAGKGNLVKDYPHVPGIDFAGRVRSSADPSFAPGDRVILTGWRVGELRWGGLATRARVRAEELVRTPQGLSEAEAMTFGTAGLTAMLALIALEEQGIRPSDGPILITGATGGVGSVATALAAALGYRVAALTRKAAAADYLRSLGADELVDQAAFAASPKRPLARETWAGGIDAIGGESLARLLSQLKYGGAVAAVGLASSSDLPTSVIPFIIRGARLIGIDSVMASIDRRQEAWERLSTVGREILPKLKTRSIGLTEVQVEAESLLSGEIIGRILVNP